MEVEVKLIPSEDFMDLALLYVKMCEYLPETNDAASALNGLTNDLAKFQFIAMGLYEDSFLTGFVTGYALSPQKFHFSGIYVVQKTRNIKQLIEYSLDHVRELGFACWEAHCISDNISSMLSKYGAKPVFTIVKGIY